MNVYKIISDVLGESSSVDRREEFVTGNSIDRVAVAHALSLEGFEDRVTVVAIIEVGTISADYSDARRSF